MQRAGGFQKTIVGLSLAYGNQKWRVMITYSLDDGPGAGKYVVKYEKDSKPSDEQDGITSDLAGAENVAAYGFTYGGNYFAAMFIYTTA